MTTNQLTLILGGARSGKSTYAETQAKNSGERILYIATAAVGDEEMAIRVKRHQEDRPKSWITLEAQKNIAQAFQALETAPDGVILDCLTLLVSNILLSFPENTPESDVLTALNAELDSLLEIIHKSQCPWFIVANEVGLGLVPPYALGRMYRDLLGRANQKLAAAAQQVIFMVAGIPMIVK